MSYVHILLTRWVLFLHFYTYFYVLLVNHGKAVGKAAILSYVLSDSQKMFLLLYYKFFLNECQTMLELCTLQHQHREPRQGKPLVDIYGSSSRAPRQPGKNVTASGWSLKHNGFLDLFFETVLRVKFLTLGGKSDQYTSSTQLLAFNYHEAVSILITHDFPKFYTE